jgi:hypothetical protein
MTASDAFARQRRWQPFGRRAGRANAEERIYDDIGTAEEILLCKQLRPG